MSGASQSLRVGDEGADKRKAKRMAQTLARIVARMTEADRQNDIRIQELARQEQAQEEKASTFDTPKKRRVGIGGPCVSTLESYVVACSACVFQPCQLHCDTCQSCNTSTCALHGEVQGLHEARVLAGMVSPSSRISPGVSKVKSRVYKPHAPLKESPFKVNPCCAKKPPCCEYFKDDIEAFRQCCLLPNEPRTVSAARCKAHKAQSRMQGGKHYCDRFMEYWSGISGGSFRKGVSKRGRYALHTSGTSLRKDSCIIAWFNILKESIEMQPDKHEFHLAAVHKTDVFKWYVTDSAEYPTVFPDLDETYFNKIWRTQVMEVKLRRVLRFTKCLQCDRLREDRRNTKLPRPERDAAHVKLEDHYRLVKRERYDCTRRKHPSKHRHIHHYIISLLLIGRSRGRKHIEQ